jgi:hypothetical protein
MQFFLSKKILLLVDTYQRKFARNTKKSDIQQRLQQLSLGTFKNCISNLIGFIINNIRMILLTIVATFFFIQIFAGAMTAFRKNPPIKHKQYSFNERIEYISGLPSFKDRRFAVSNFGKNHRRWNASQHLTTYKHHR